MYVKYSTYVYMYNIYLSFQYSFIYINIPNIHMRTHYIHTYSEVESGTACYHECNGVFKGLFSC